MTARRNATARIDSADAARLRRRRVIESARNAGLLAGENRWIGGRIRRRLIVTAKEQSNISSDTELLEYALAKVAIEENFGVNLLKRKGTVSRDLDFEF